MPDEKKVAVEEEELGSDEEAERMVARVMEEQKLEDRIRGDVGDDDMMDEDDPPPIDNK